MKLLGFILFVVFSVQSKAQTVTAFTPTTVDSRIELNFGRSIAIGGSNIIHQVWIETTTIHNVGDVTGKIMYRLSPDGGKTWMANKALTGSIRTGIPKIAAYGPYLYIVYHQVESTGQSIKLLFSKEAGGFYQSSVLPTPITVGTNGSMPSVAAYGSLVHIVFAAFISTKRSEIHHRGAYIENSQLKWMTAKPTMISSNDDRSSWTPDVAAEKTNVYVTWTDERHNSVDCADTSSAECYEEVYYNRSDLYGTTWKGEKRLTTVPSQVGHNASSIAVSDGTVHIGLYRKPLGSIFYMRLTNNGADPKPEVEIAVDSKIEFGRPAIIAQGPNVQIAFHGMITGVGFKLYRTKSVDGGVSFGTGSPIFTEIPSTVEVSYQPSIAVDGLGKTHMIFAGRNLADSKFQMFYSAW